MILMTLLFTSLFSHAASLAPISSSEVLLVGPITESTGENFAVQFNKVLFLLPENTPLTIYLNSEGGSLDSAESMVKVIRTAQKYGVEVRTVVPNASQIEGLFNKADHFTKTVDSDSIAIRPSELPKKAICLSACTLLFAAGNKRIASMEAIFLFHAPQFAEWLMGAASEEERKADAAIYAKVWLSVISSASPRMAKFLTDEIGVFKDFSKEFVASADQIHKTFPDFVQEVQK